MEGWRKLKNWRWELKSQIREVGRISSSGGKNKQEKLEKATQLYLTKNRLLLHKLVLEKNNFPIHDLKDVAKYYEEQDRDIVVEIADAVLKKYKIIDSMSFDKGHWSAENKALLQLEIPNVILPKLGKLTVQEKEIEESRKFKSLKNKHSAIESNINELEHRGLDRCPDRSYRHFKTYIAWGVCAYNLKKIGKKVLENQLKEMQEKQAA
jgi:hypothetical protein